MKPIQMLLFIALAFAALQANAIETLKADEVTTPTEDAETDFCLATIALSDISRKLVAQRKLEAVSGVKNLTATHELTVEFMAEMENFKEAGQNPLAKNAMNNGCEGVSSADEKRLVDEIERTMKKSKGVK